MAGEIGKTEIGKTLRDHFIDTYGHRIDAAAAMAGILTRTPIVADLNWDIGIAAGVDPHTREGAIDIAIGVFPEVTVQQIRELNGWVEKTDSPADPVVNGNPARDRLDEARDEADGWDMQMEHRAIVAGLIYVGDCVRAAADQIVNSHGLPDLDEIGHGIEEIRDSEVRF